MYLIVVGGHESTTPVKATEDVEEAVRVGRELKCLIRQLRGYSLINPPKRLTKEQNSALWRKYDDVKSKNCIDEADFGEDSICILRQKEPIGFECVCGEVGLEPTETIFR